MRFPVTTQNNPGKIPVVYVKAKVAKSRSRQKGCEVLVPVSLSQRFPASDKAQVWAFQPLGSERAIEINGRVFKGAGQRDDEVTYFSRTVGTPGSGLHFIKPFDINIHEEASNTQFMLGGSPFSPLDYEFRKAAAIVRIFKKMGLDNKGLVSPLNIYELQEFPVIDEEGSIRMLKGEDLFMNPEFMTPQQRVVVLNWLEDHSQYGLSASIARAMFSSGMELEVEQQKALARAFVREFRPAIYEYKGGIGVRVSNVSVAIENEHGELRDILVENGEINEGALLGPQGDKIRQKIYDGIAAIEVDDRSAGLDQAEISAIKEIIDKQIGSLYFSLGHEITFPETTCQDLHTKAGRLDYLREIRLMNQCYAEEVSKRFIRITAQQLGLIHGTGGHGGGCCLISRIGVVRLDFQDAEGNDYRCAFALANEGQKRDLFHWFEKGTPEEGRHGRPRKKLDLRKIWFINHGGDLFDEMGTYGGITRGDNVATTGFRDFDTVRLYGRDRMIDQLIEKYHPRNLFRGWERSFLKYCYIHQKQKADISLFLMAFSWRELKYIPGTLMNFAALLGSNYDDYQALEDLFLQEYCHWRSRGLQKLAPEWFRRIEERLNKGALEFEYEPKAEAYLNNESQKRIVYNLVLNPTSSSPRSL